jgi:streptogramin lyase
VITEFSVPGNPNGIATGADGNLWFTDPASNSVDRFSFDGIVTAYTLPGTNVNPVEITAGPDGNMWYLEHNTQGANPPIAYVGRITTAGVATQYATGSGGFLSGLAIGPDGNLWFNEVDVFKVAKMTMSGALTEYTNPNGPSAQEVGIAAGPDGNMWVTDAAGNTVWKVTTRGAFTPYPLPTPNRGAAAITVGADGNLWFFEGNVNKIGRMTTSGTLTEFSIPTANAGVAGLVAGIDGNVWFIEAGPNQVGVISQTGVIHEYPIPTANSYPRGPTLGPDHHIWFSEYAGNIARIAGAGRSADAAPPLVGHTTPVIPRSAPPPVVQSSPSVKSAAGGQGTVAPAAPPATRKLSPTPLISASLFDAILQRLRDFF